MAWDFETDPEFQKKLDWIEAFMTDEVEPISYLGMAVWGSEGREKFIKPLQQKVITVVGRSVPGVEGHEVAAAVLAPPAQRRIRMLR